MGYLLRKESIYIAILNNQPLTPMHLSVYQQAELWFVPDENLRKTRVWDISCARIWSILQVSTTSP